MPKSKYIFFIALDCGIILFIAFIDPVNDTFALLFIIVARQHSSRRSSYRAALDIVFNDVYKSVEAFHVEFPLKCCYISALRSGGN